MCVFCEFKETNKKLDRWFLCVTIKLIETVQKKGGDAVKRSVTIKDVAKHAGLSVGTVSMALNNSDKISEATKKAVRKAVSELGYRANPFGRFLSTNTSRSIGCLVPDLTNPFYGQLLESIQREVEARGISLLIGLTNENSAVENKLINQFIDQGVDGIMMIPSTDTKRDISLIKKLLDDKFPLSFISSYYPELPVNTVMSDLKMGSYLMTKHLISSGQKKIVLVSGNKEFVQFDERISGYKESFKEAGLDFDPSWIIESDVVTYQGGYNAVQGVYEEKEPDAIMAINDVMAMGIISQMRAHGVRVPEDVSVAGYDDLSISAIQETPLSTVKQNFSLMGREAVNMLFRLISGGEREGIIRTSVELVLRKSTDKNL